MNISPQQIYERLPLVIIVREKSKNCSILCMRISITSIIQPPYQAFSVAADSLRFDCPTPYQTCKALEAFYVDAQNPENTRHLHFIHPDVPALGKGD